MDQFKENVKKSFLAAKEDADAIKQDVKAFKDNVSDWFIFFDSMNKELLEKVTLLEKRIAELEAEKISTSMQREKFIYR